MDEKGIWDYSPQLRTFTRRKKTKSNPYVSGLNDTRQNGRDTLAATVSFSGKQLPAFTIQHRRRKTKTITTDGIKRNVIVDRGCAGMNGILFQKWAVFFLKHASRGDVLILDNLGSHKNKKALEMLKNAGIKVCFTPPYSASKVSPLDNSFFSVLSSKIERLDEIFHSFQNKTDTIQNLLDSIRPRTIINFFKLCKLPFKLDQKIKYSVRNYSKKFN
ncbi:integrase protein-related [Anaeramoeba flamelloides]|uniref:Integrase protein-related n=1 Tax=Anaeramoeba flamelloides TaxID=1746091 RepID=A0AAV8ABW5_9EUKA|nr:integrase protein-related [Anaeramoeba flamelloides]